MMKSELRLPLLWFLHKAPTDITVTQGAEPPWAREFALARIQARHLQLGRFLCPLAGGQAGLLLRTPNGLLLTPSPLLSSIHFWSSLSPVAPLSPARLQGPNTLFQFPTLLNGHMPVPIPSLDRAASPVLLSSTSQKS
ncbi:ETS domain-containing protein Elk-3 [Myotis brandtii]|uniref:ETS domain-containing protein Elk-3 n=1 Tax=Myotis brandtii TaxID=109478 RepID=S7Q9N9_MYOBR|nr:ETS domain-containing protein Elk-3 [Myotis brandtii]